jgi:DNA-binding transcriptional MerR regulator
MPTDLTAHHGGVWTLSEFVETVNALLPDYLPKEASGRAADEVNARLVRHYTTLGLLPEPLKEGREARYLFDHLLRLLVVRRLLAEGFSSSAIATVLRGRDAHALQGLLEGTLRVELVPAPAATERDERLEFLRELRQKAGLEVERAAPLDEPADEAYDEFTVAMRLPDDDPRPTRRQPHPFDDVTWSRVEIVDGLELHVREDFELPATRLGDEQLVQLVRAVLLHLEQKGKGKR